ncbi:MAG: MFS transporter [Verrucomicrobia bacterium]|nr:MFS transporter [Verrucomicrobiota bacterium]
MADTTAAIESPALARARTKAYWHLIPLLFVSYMIAYVDRSNVAIAKLTMVRDLPAFDNAVIGFGAGVFFIGYFLLEIPGTLLVEKWSARKWISRIMISWGLIAAMTAFVHCRIPGFTHVAELLIKGLVAILTPLAGGPGWVGTTAKDMVDQFSSSEGLAIFQFYSVRFLLGLAEAGFYPGVIVYLTHWFPVRDRARALAYFFVATPIAQMVSPKISNLMLKIGTDELINGVTVHHPQWMGMSGWQLIYIFWGIPAVVLGVMVLFMLPDKPHHAKWLTAEERAALEAELEREKNLGGGRKHMTVLQALSHPKVLLLTAAYFFVVTANYGVEFFLPSILQDWYHLKFNDLTWLVILPPCLSLVGQLFVGWNSDRLKERRLHTVIPIALGAVAVAVAPFTQNHLALTVVAFMVAMGGLKAYLPAFWALPNLFLSSAAAAGSIGLINSVGNLGGFLGPWMMGKLQTMTGSFSGGLTCLSVSMLVTATLIFLLGLGKTEEKKV